MDAEKRRTEILKEEAAKLRGRTATTEEVERLIALADGPPPAEESPPFFSRLARPLARVWKSIFIRRPVRVGFLYPKLHLGGAEIWLDMLIAHRDPRIEWAGVNLWLPGSDEKMKAGLTEKTVVSEGDDGATSLAERSDVLVAWNVDSVSDRVPNFTGPVVLVSHGAGEWSAKMAALAGDRVTHFAAVSETAAEAFKGLTMDVKILHNGADPARARPTRPRDEVRAEWGLRPREKAVGFVGRYSWEKNPLAAAIACAQLGPRYRPIYVGDGWKREEVYAAIEQIHRRAIVRPRTDRVGDVLAGLDCFVLASPSEGFSLGMTEAWLAGVPVVATRVGAVPEIESVHGRLIEPVPVCPTPGDLARAVRRAISERNHPTIDRARQVAAEHFTAQTMGRRWCDWLSKIS